MRGRLSTVKYAFIWFGAAVSLAEIMTGTFFAPLGFELGMLAIVVGHLIGGVLFWLAAYVGAKTGKPAMESVKIAFGSHGSLVFALANIAQLLGWTAIMIVAGAAAAQFLVPAFGHVAWCFVIGALIVIWIASGLKSGSALQGFAAVLLLGLTFVMSFVVYGGIPPGTEAAASEGISFGAAVELAAAMPLSWLPVVGDYTSRAKKPVAATTVATLSYIVGSCWMFALGLGAALFLGTGDIAQIMASAGLGHIGLLVVIFSTVTTTYLDAASVGISFTSIFKRANAKYIGIAAALIGTVLASWAPVASFEPFLYLIGSVFAPMIALLFVDFYLIRTDASTRSLNGLNLGLWVVGFILYRVSMTWDLPCGNTLVVMLVIVAVSFIIQKTKQYFTASHSVIANQKENTHE